jgi:competence transcription factor ComK
MYPKELKAGSKESICIFMLTIASFIKTVTQKQPKHSTTDMQNVHIHKWNSISSLKRMEILHYAVTWINLENIILRLASHKMTNTV